MGNPLFNHTITVAIFCLMFAIGINHSFEQLTSLWRRPTSMLRSLLAVIVLVPLVVIILLQLMNVPPAVAAALAVLAAAPGAPMTFKRSQMAGADPVFTASLQMTLALIAVVITPLTLAIFYSLFDFFTKRVTPVEVALQVGQVTFIPVVIALVLQRLAPQFAQIIRRPATVLANIMFIVLVLLIVVVLAMAPDLLGKMRIGVPSITAMVIMIGVALIGGHLLGGPSPGERSGLAIACIARNVGLCLYIASLSDDGQKIIPAVLTFIIAGTILGVPYSIFSKRRSSFV